MRLLASLVAMGAVILARADRLLLVPTAHGLGPGAVRAEGWYATGFGQPRAVFAGFGLGSGVEAQARWVQLASPAGPAAVDLQYTYISPVADISPGLATGVLDAFDTTEDGRRIYACATLNRGPGYGRYAEFTVGLAVGRRSGPMAGLRVPLGRSTVALGEYDGVRWSGGVEYKLNAQVYGRIVESEGLFVLGFGIRT